MAVVCSIGSDRVQDAIDAVRAGRIVMLVDEPDEPGPGVLLAAAATTTPETINFMVTEGRGLIRLALTAERCDAIGRRRGGEDPARPYAFSVDARDGITTGASATDRARTISVAISPRSRPRDLVRPGHVFVAPAGGAGTLAQQRFIDAAIDLPALGGLPAAGVVCDVLDSQGDLASGRDLAALAARHGLVRISIAQLTGQPRRAVQRIADTALPTPYGPLTAVGYRSVLDGVAHLVLVKGDVRGAEDVPVTIHRECLAGDVFRSRACGCRAGLDRALRTIADSPRGVLIRLNGPRDGHGYLGISPASATDGDRHQALGAGERRICRDILADLGLERPAIPRRGAG